MRIRRVALAAFVVCGLGEIRPSTANSSPARRLVSADAPLRQVPSAIATVARVGGTITRRIPLWISLPVQLRRSPGKCRRPALAFEKIEPRRRSQPRTAHVNHSTPRAVSPARESRQWNGTADGPPGRLHTKSRANCTAATPHWVLHKRSARGASTFFSDPRDHQKIQIFAPCRGQSISAH